MSRDRDLALLKLALGSGIDLMTQMPFVSGVLKRLVPSFSLSMIRVDERCAPQEHYSEHFDEASHGLFASAGHQFAARSDDPAAFGNLLRNERRCGSLLGTPRAFIEGATYQHLFKRNGIHHVLDIALRDGTGPLGILGIFREERAPGFTRSDVATMNAVYPHLVHATAQRNIHEIESFDEHDSAMLIVDAGGAITWASPGARAWLEDASGGPERAALMDRGVLPAACRHLYRVWTHAQTSHTQRSRRDEVATLALPVAGGRLRLRAYGLTATLPSSAPPRHVGIQLALEMSRDMRVLRALERSTLTAQQCRIAFGYWRRRAPAAIRDDLSISAGTLKSYQKDLYSRLDVRGAVELVERLDATARKVDFDLRAHLPRTGS